MLRNSEASRAIGATRPCGAGGLGSSINSREDGSRINNSIRSQLLAASPLRRITNTSTSNTPRSWRLKREFLLTSVLAIFAAASAFGTETNAFTIPADTINANPLQPLLDGLLGKYGWLTTVILIVGSLRILFKPVMLALENYVRQTPSPNDDERLAKFEAGPVYKIIAFLLDFGASIKLPLVSPPSKSDPAQE